MSKPFPSIIFQNTKLSTILILLITVTMSGITQGELPPISTFAYSEYGGGRQNWMIDQADNGNVYVANNEGLLEYNGTNWRLYPTENETIMRSVHAHGDRVYSGCYMDFGYWSADSTGYLVYNSLAHLLPRPMLEDEQVWNIHHSDHRIIFQSMDQIFIYDRKTDDVKILEFEHGIVRSYQVGEAIYFQSMGQGLYEILYGQSQLVSDDVLFQNQLIIGMFRMGDDLVAINKDGHWINIQEETLEVTSINPNGENMTVYSAIKLGDDEIVLGTIAQGVVVVNNQIQITQNYNQEDGLANNTVLSLYNDKEKALWLGLDDGINIIHQESILRIAKFEEDIGSVYSSVVHDDRLYLGTNQGLYYKEVNKPGTFYQLCQGTQGQVWNLEVIDELLFCAHNNGVFIIDDATVVKHISDILGAWGFRRVPNHDNLILTGSYSNSGLHVLAKQGDQWQFRNHIDDYKMSSRFFEWIDDTTIMVNHEYKGLHRIELDGDFRKAINVEREEDVEKGRHSSLVKHNDKILYCKSGGIWEYNHAQGDFIKNNKLSALQQEQDYISGKLVSTDDRLWMFTSNFVHSIGRDRFNGANNITSIPLIQAYREGNYGYENISHLGGQKYLVGSSVGYSIIDLDAVSNNHTPSIRLAEVRVTNTQEQSTRRVLLDGGLKLTHQENNLSFGITVNSYDPTKPIGIEYRLGGQQWIHVHTASPIQLNQLKPGDYTIEIRRKYRKEVDISYDFEIKKPWYGTNLAIMGYLGIASLLFLLVNRLSANYYLREQKRLIEQNRKTLELKELETREQIIKMENEKLQLDIENKNRELGISTINMAKQNEILSAIRSELSKLKGGKEINSIIKLVDRNINAEEDWNMFEKAFNEADKGFFRKIKSAHPELTPGDLKLCAYLRLNLSSKAIGPLLNISTRSVEIKRYRLRKKLNLQHEEGLADYLLNL